MLIEPCSRRSLLRLSLLLPAAAVAQEGASVVEGVAFERRARVAGSELLLNGTGVRAVAWFKGYAAALYLAERAASAAQALAAPGPKRLQIRLLHDVPAAEFAKAFRKGVARNVTPAELARLAPRMDRFAAAIGAVGTVRQGDVVDLDLDPGHGTRFALNGTLRADIGGDDGFYAALLLSFVGDRPYDERLRAGLLGQGG